MYRLMIIDDEERITDGLKALIDWKELRISRVETANSCEEALEKAVDYHPDIALVDICIHDRKGYEIIDELNRFGLSTRYIMISGYDDFQYVKLAMQRGAKDYLLKPIDKTELRNAIIRIITEELNGEPFENACRDYDPVFRNNYSEYSKLTQKIVMLVRQNYGENLSLKVIADKFAMNNTYLGQLFQKDTGIKFTDYLMQYRMAMAKQMIEETDDKIAVIAGAVGYPNTGYFYTQFQSYFGVSPLDFRKCNTERGRQRGNEQ